MTLAEAAAGLSVVPFEEAPVPSAPFRFIGPSSLRLVVCGANRSGTKYVAQLLSEAGLPCGHERVFATHGVVDWGASTVDSSGFAIPYLGSLHRSTTVAHVVRHPLRWAQSYRTKQVALSLAQRYLSFDYWYARRAVGIDAASLGIWVDWNLQIEAYAEWRFRVEDADVLTIERLARAAGAVVDASAAWRAITAVPKTTNSARSAAAGEARLEWKDLPDCREVRRARELAARYGYGDG